MPIIGVGSSPLAGGTFSDVFDAIALLVGGTQPDPVTLPFFYSGAQVGDTSAIPGINGCYSMPPEVINCDPPFGVLLLSTGTDGSDFRGGTILMQGENYKQDMIRLQICVGRTSPAKQQDTLVNLRDVIPATFAAHLTLSSTPTVLETFPQDYRFAAVTWGGTDYQCMEFRIRCRRQVTQTYTP